MAATVSNKFVSVTRSNMEHTNPDAFSRHPLNSSCSKMQYSFPRSDRFSYRHEKDIPFYNLPNRLSKRSTSFGYGSKSSFEDTRGVPPPNKYFVLRSFVDQKHGISFGVGREQAANGSAFVKSEVPGPGTYTAKLSRNTPKYSIYAKTIDHSMDEKLKMPGPAHYNLAALITRDGRYSASKYENSKCSYIPKAELRIKTEESPAPNSYFPRFLNSRGEKSMLQTRTSKFGRSRRDGLYPKNSNPGPGQQYPFLQFSKEFSQFLH